LINQKRKLREVWHVTKMRAIRNMFRLEGMKEKDDSRRSTHGGIILKCIFKE
jgi:hypothetical protein